MHIPRIYQPIKLVSDQTIELTKEAANHLVRVLRLPVGAEFRVFNGEGGEYVAKLISISKQQVMAKIAKHFVFQVESPLAIHLGQAIARGEKMDYTIQKAVELGVTQITPLLTERCGVKLSQERWEKRLQHWRAIVIAACEQSGRDQIPLVAEPQLLTQWIAQAHADLKLILDPEAQQKLANFSQKPKSVNLLIGPEGGFAPAEINLATQNHFLALNLGPRILRTETAALVAITALQCRFGDLV
jgi:16S rRNA (uracil1498-N3)-methyltransferase